MTRLFLCLATLLTACGGPTEIGREGAPAGSTRLNRLDCFGAVTPAEIAARDVIINPSAGVRPGSMRTMRAIVFNGDANGLAHALCNDTLTQSDVEQGWTADAPDAIDLSRFAGMTLYVAALDDGDSVLDDGIYQINAASAVVEVSLD